MKKETVAKILKARLLTPNAICKSRMLLIDKNSDRGLLTTPSFFSGLFK